MNKTCFVYIAIAVGNSLLSATTKPATKWDMFRYFLGTIVAGFMAWKTYYSVPPTDPPKD